MAWTELKTDETAEELKTRIASSWVEISKDSGSTISSYNGKAPLRQVQSQTVGEYRGLSQEAAEKLVELANDGTTTVVYYSSRYATGAAGFLACGVRSGTVVAVSASRVSEAKGWSARLTTTNYDVTAGDGWSTTRPTGATDGTIVSKRSDVTRYYNPSGGFAKATVTTTTVTEYSLLTLDEANDKLSSSNSIQTNWFYHSYTGYSYNASTSAWSSYSAQCQIFWQSGTKVSSEMSYVDETYGWTVRVTSEVTNGL
jgi:hypothetical protein